MPELNEAARVRRWARNITAADKVYKEWSERYETDRCEQYYLGRQWKGLPEEEARRRYVVNLVFSTIEVNKPSLSFDKPQIRMQPRPGRRDDWGSRAEERARLCEDTVQTFIDDPDIDFSLETSLALHEAHFRFGVVEVGYSSDWIDNPNARKPILDPDGNELKDSDGAVVVEPDRLIEREGLYVRRIPASHFRVSSGSIENKLAKNEWVGYYEWHYLSDVKKNPAYKNTANLKSTASIRKARRDDLPAPVDVEGQYGMVRLWKIWDMRSGTRMVLADNHPKFLLDGVPFKFLPFAVLKFYEILDSFYPLPPVYQWLDPQNEVNDMREMQRVHARRFYRRYQRLKNSVDQSELEKLETGGDGVCIETNVPNAIQPVPDAPLGADIWKHLDESKIDFMSVSGVGAEQRGAAESETATQAAIIDQRARIREVSARTKVSNWLAEIARLMLMTIRDNMALPFWIKRNIDPISADASEMFRVTDLWRQITAEDLGDINMDIYVELASMSPITLASERHDWNQVLALLANPALVAIMAQSETLLRRTLRLYNIRSENEIREISKVVLNAAQVARQAPGTSPAPVPEPPPPGETPAELGGRPLVVQ